MDTTTAALLVPLALGMVASALALGRTLRLRRPLLLALSGLLAAVALAVIQSPVQAAPGPPLAWGARNPVAGIDGLTAIACPSATLCVAGGDLSGFDGFVRFATTSTPAVAGSWKVVSVPAGDVNSGINSISCPSVNLCVAVDGYGHIFSSTDPAGPASAWQVFTFTDGTGTSAPKRVFTNVSCPSASRCVAVDQRGYVATTTAPTTSTWTFTGSQLSWRHVSCTPTFCVANGSGSIYTTTNPDAAASTWTKTDIEPTYGVGILDATLSTVVCYAPTTCIATDTGGAETTAKTWSSLNALGGAATWSSVKNAPMDRLTCVQGATSLCVGWSLYGAFVNATTAPPGGTADWVATEGVADVTVSDHIQDVSCPTPAMCVAVTSRGVTIVGTATGTGTGGGGPGGGSTNLPPIGPGGGPGLDGGNSFRAGDDAVSFALNSANDVTGSIAASTAASYAAGDYSRLLAEAKPQKKHVKVGSARFSLKAGVTQTVRLKLTRAARTLLAARHSLKVVLTITATTKAGVRTVSTHTVKIKAAKRK